MKRRIRLNSLEQLQQFLDSKEYGNEVIDEIKIDIKTPENPYGSSPEAYNIESRGCGNTTRMIDWFIQELFANKGDWVEVYDHCDHKESHSGLAHKVLDRLVREHPRVVYSTVFGCGEYKIRIDK